MGGFRSRRCTEIQEEFILLRIENEDGKHTCCFLSRYTSRVVKQCEQFSCPITRRFATSKRKLIRFIANRPCKRRCTHIEELLSRPFHVVVVHGETKCFWKWLRCCLNPFAAIDTERFSKTSKRCNFCLGEETVLTTPLAHTSP